MFCKSGFNKVYLKYKGILAKYYCDNSNFKEISTTEQSIDIDNEIMWPNEKQHITNKE